MLEIETKIADINRKSLEKQFKAKKVKFLEKVFFKRWVFPLSQKNGEDNYIRVRTDGKKSTLTYKFRKGKGLRNTEEVETEVESFDRTVEILSKLIKEKYYQETTREIYSYKRVEITINKWPRIPEYIEIEGPSVKEIYGCIKDLKIEGKVLGNISVVKLYKFYGKDIRKSK